MRLFVGVGVDDVVTARLSSALRPLWGEGHDMAWTRPGGWHVTLAFVGETDTSPEDVAGWLVDALDGVGVPAMALRGASSWWDRSLVLPVDDDGWSARVGDRLQEQLVLQGLDVAGREVRPHVTVGRRRGERRDPEPFPASHLDDLVASVDLSWRPASIDVFRSVTGDGPARYPVVATVALD